MLTGILLGIITTLVGVVISLFKKMRKMEIALLDEVLEAKMALVKEVTESNAHKRKHIEVLQQNINLLREVRSLKEQYNVLYSAFNDKHVN